MLYLCMKYIRAYFSNFNTENEFAMCRCRYVACRAIHHYIRILTINIRKCEQIASIWKLWFAENLHAITLYTFDVQCPLDVFNFFACPLFLPLFCHSRSLSRSSWPLIVIRNILTFLPSCHNFAAHPRITVIMILLNCILEIIISIFYAYNSLQKRFATVFAVGNRIGECIDESQILIYCLIYYSTFNISILSYAQRYIG